MAAAAIEASSCAKALAQMLRRQDLDTTMTGSNEIGRKNFRLPAKAGTKAGVALMLALGLTGAIAGCGHGGNRKAKLQLAASSVSRMRWRLARSSADRSCR